ncbi:hypothetical protein MRX96_007066 [Rhipicephalus microplus]
MASDWRARPRVCALHPGGRPVSGVEGVPPLTSHTHTRTFYRLGFSGRYSRALTERPDGASLVPPHAHPLGKSATALQKPLQQADTGRHRRDAAISSEGPPLVSTIGRTNELRASDVACALRGQCANKWHICPE